ncbi:glycosyltransferase family 2 protein [Chitinophaga japonensis]|uniref:Glycosyl transferase family 2 n=1 Tax=Chitinophaga japonensis TaxID=104662 RepID=A0A562T3V6_CHIJA|nr:glycosyltransferase family 2 protein [Chitinophaga japonensis]TWI88219.1 glycosyl transferase family 2 [Chitinophaga japonensis]
MSRHPLVSVIIPCYNGASYIRQALESISAQTYQQLEILVLDDGSTDGSYSVITECSRQDDRIKVIRHERNEKLIATLNKGIELAQGKYIARMDADDIALPDRIEKQVTFMEAHPEAGICGTFMAVFDEQGRRRKSRLPVTPGRIKAYLFTACAFFHPTVMIRREILCRWELRYEQQYYRAEDHALWLHVTERAEGANLPVVLLKYRLLADSETRQAERDREARRKVLMQIHQLALSKIGIALSPEEQLLYSCSMVRMDIELAKHKPVRELIGLYKKILTAASRSGYVNVKYLGQYLAVRFIAFLYYSGQFRKPRHLLDALRSDYFYTGVYLFIREKRAY